MTQAAFNIDAACEAAKKRLAATLARSVAQHKRQVREGFRAAQQDTNKNNQETAQ